MPQANAEPLEYIRKYFGGRLNGPYADNMYYLYLNGKRAWDFLVKISPLLSERRLDQLTRACAKVSYFEGGEVVLRGCSLT